MGAQGPTSRDRFDELYLATYADLTGDRYTVPEVEAIERLLGTAAGVDAARLSPAARAATSFT